MFDQYRFPLASSKTLIQIARCRPAARTRTRRPGRIRRAAAALGLLGMLGIMGALFMGSAAATVTAGCSGQVNESTFQSITLASPLRITENQTLNVRAGSQLRVRLYVVRMYYFGIRYAIRGGTTTDNTWQGTFNASQVFTRGTGNYIVEGILTNNQVGVVCLATLYIHVIGNPLEGPVSQGAAGVTAAGLLGLIATAVTGGKVPLGFESTTTPEDEEKIKEKQEDEKKNRDKLIEEEAEAKRKSEKACWFLVLPALLMTAGMMASGGGTSAAEVASPGRVRWRPRLSFVAIGSGMLFALGSGVLLQQYGVIWPTLGMGIAFLIGGIALGIMVPTLTRLRVVRKLNQRFADVESREAPKTRSDGVQDEDLPEEDAGIPADWYADPSGEARLRYWDGNEWTSNTAD
jgi:uncharacterized protein DUF2510